MKLTAFCLPADQVPFNRSCRGLRKQNMRIMKLTAFLLLIGCLHVCAKGSGQKVTLFRSNASLQEVLMDISNQTGISYSGKHELLEKAEKVTIAVRDVPLEQALTICFKNQPLIYSIRDNVIIITEKIINVNGLYKESAPIDVHGRVISDDGTPVQGATIKVKETGDMTSADNDGNFHIITTTSIATFVISSVGHETQEVKFNGKGFLNIVLRQLINQLDETIIKGYYVTTKRLNTGSVSKITSEVISKQPVSNPLEALEGRVSGLYIQQVSGVPGSGFSVMIRGKNSIASGNDPFYIIDGVPFISTSLSAGATGGQIVPSSNPLNNINPADIESIEILKDADATAIYGSRGANGVVLINTKKGKAGTTRFNVNVYSGAGKVTRTMDLLNTQQYLQIRHEAFNNDNLTIQPFHYDINGTWDSTRYTDWQKALIGGTAHTTDAQGSISGGNMNTQFIMGGGYHRETTVFPGDFANQKASVHLSLTHNSADQKFRAIFSSSYVVDNNNLLVQDLTSQALTLPPDAPSLYDSSGKLNWANSTWTNPLSYLQQKYKANTNNLIANTILSYQLLPELQLKTSLGYTNMALKEIRTNPKSASNPAFINSAQASSTFSNANVNTWIIEPQINFHKTWGGNQFEILAGTTFQQNAQQVLTMLGSGYNNDALIENIQAAPRIVVSGSNNTLYRYNAVFSRINYNWKEKYLINLTARRDGSSRFGPGKQFANFGAVGIGWIFSREIFIQDNLPFISFGKLRGSYGTSGNDQIGDYQYLSNYSTSGVVYQGVLGLTPMQLFNSDYAWEVNKKSDVGLELGFLKDRIYLTVSYYSNRSSNQLVGYSLPPTTGFPSIIANLPATVQNTGLELEFNSINLKTKNFSWTSSFNISIPNNKLISYPNLSASTYANSYVVGQPLFIRKLYHYIGVDPQTGLYTFDTKNSNGTPSYPNDLHALKKIAQVYYGGFQNTVHYKGWQLDIFFQFVKQTGYNYLSGLFGMPGSMINQPTVVLNRWQKPGDNTTIEMVTKNFASPAASAFSTMKSSDNIISDASFIRLKNLALSYQLPDKWKQKLNLQNCRIYVQGQNLFTITKFLGMDPENQSVFGLPPLQMLTAGIQLTL